MASTKPLPPIKDSNRIGGDVYIRDPDDASIQYKARTFSLNYETQEADLGLFPRRWGTFSQLHLPSEYRITVPLTELSLTPYAGAEQRGFEDMLILRGEKPPVWMDNAGRVHPPGCDEPAVVEPVTIVDVGGVPEPEFSPADSDKVMETVNATLALAEGIIKKEEERAPARETAVVAVVKGKKPLYTKAEVLAKFDSVAEEFAKLRRMLEAVL